jgi:NADH-quinone oxidoreductase subunit L
MAWLLLLAPLFSAAAITFWTRPWRGLSQGVSVAAVAVSFAVAVGLFTGAVRPPEPLVWMDLHGLYIQVGFVADPLAKLMLLVVTGVGLLVHLFSIGYMREDAGISRFFAKLSLFIFSMIGIVVADNLVTMFVFWELVGLSSYLLVGFWFERPTAVEAAKKAFLCNRVGDFGFIAGILLFWSLTGTVAFDPGVHDSLAAVTGDRAWLLPALGLLLFCGCVGKSAQLPLHVWLPDAMEGPTPVSALIHAATMVAAGIYMLSRIFFVLQMAPLALDVIAWTGGITALFAALIATQQTDIKRILAYSTLSQLGYMVMAVGCGGWPAAMFHLTTHAFFKALLFLGAGSVIHAMHHEQEMWQMGGLRKKLPLTFWTFLIGTLALSGVPFLSGFFSKEAIFAVAWNSHPALFWIAAGTAGLTAFYMLRLLVTVFFGEPKSAAAAHAHESPAVMTLPLVILAVLAVVAGYPALGIAGFLSPASEALHSPLILPVSLVVVTVGLFCGWYLYRGRKSDPISIPLFANKFYVDEIYDATLLAFQARLAWMADWFDRWVIGFGAVRGAAFGASVSGEFLRLFQAGNVRGYAFLFSLGAALLLYLLFS